MTMRCPYCLSYQVDTLNQAKRLAVLSVLSQEQPSGASKLFYWRKSWSIYWCSGWPVGSVVGGFAGAFIRWLSWGVAQVVLLGLNSVNLLTITF